MKSTMSAIGAALIATALTAAPAYAQQTYTPPPRNPEIPDIPQQQPEPQDDSQQAQSQEPTDPNQPKVSRKAVKAIQELQAALKTGNAADIASKIAAANAVASTPDDRYMIGVLRYQAAVSMKDDTARVSAIEAMLQSGFPATPRADLYADLGATYSRLNQDARAVQAFQQALQVNPNSVAAMAGVAESMIEAGQTAEGVALLQKGIALQSASGAKASESWYKRALQVAYKAKLPASIDLARQWVAAYPTTDAWQNALAIYQNIAQLDEARTLDLLRLKRATNSLSAADYFNYSDIATRKGYAGEAKAVLEEGFAANVIRRNDSGYAELYKLASQKSQGDRAGLPAAPSSGASAREILNTGDAYFGYGDYAKALEFYRAALGKQGADANVVNLHIGMALARQGDKAGATAALKSVGGPQAELAKFWMLYASTTA